jgi:tetratricopeptide (TPR) repeat protein
VKYAAFISYNHKDRRWANWLHRALETYRIPEHLHGRDSPVGVLGPKLLPVYQDREEMVSSADLATSVKVALSQSATLIVICSPSAVRSRWVDEEIRTYRALGREKFIHYLIVDGEPHASRTAGLDASLECFPAACFEGAEEFDPVAADVRPNTDGTSAAKLRLLAGMLGVGYDDLRQREAARQQRRLVAILTASVAGLALTSGLAIFALFQRAEAIEQRDLARQKSITAERTVDFVKSMFIVADPSEAKGKTITAREILDRGARQIGSSLNNEPSVKAELTTTLGEVYGSLGLFQHSDALVQQGLQIAQRSGSDAVRQLIAVGESQNRLGDFEKAIATFDKAQALVRKSGSQHLDLMPRILTGWSESQGLIENYAAAKKSAYEALRIAEAQYGKSDVAVAKALEAIGTNATWDGDYAVAQPAFLRAISIRRSVQGGLHPKVTEDLNQLGAIAYLQNDAGTAERYYRQVLKNDETVLGADHPDTALTLNNLSRVLLEQRKFGVAAQTLDKAVAINLKQSEATNYDMAFLFANRAIARRGLGNISAAEQDFRKALTAARLHKHRNLAPVLTDLADTLCDQKRFGEAFALLAEAAPIMAKTYSDDPWRSAWVNQVKGRCLVASGKRGEGAALVRSSAKPILDRWPANTLYGYAVTGNLKRLGGA